MQKFLLDHIKSFEYSGKIEIKPITIFVGKNSSGKSSLLRFPVVLAQTFREDAITPLLLFGNMIDYGNYDDVAYRHESSPLGFGISFGRELSRFVNMELRSTVDEFSLMKHLANMNADVQVYIAKPSKKLEVEKTELHLNGEKVFTLSRHSVNSYTFVIHKLYNQDGKIWENGERECEVKDTLFNKFIPLLDVESIVNQLCADMVRKNSKPLPEFRYSYTIGDYIEHNIYKKNKMEYRSIYDTVLIISAYYRAIRRQLASEAAGLAYIGPFRENPKRIYRDSESSYDDVGVNGENTSMLLRQAAQGNRKLLEDVSDWLQDAMGYKLAIKDMENGLYSLVVQGNEETDNIMDVGYGISQVLPIVTQLLNIGRNNRRMQVGHSLVQKTVIFEQPEIHLHPAAQAQLADLFVECINHKKGEINRVLIETHSEHLIRKLQVLVADPDVPILSDQVAIYYVDKDKMGNSYIDKMELCNNGQFKKPWPSGFFDKNYELTRLLMKANQKVAFQENKYD
ncbi:MULTISPECIES: DUF3696 domain-containing protein [unclassified Clostridium]|uniref:DUF3696 domain-containing protein n=1 Tax=unclassified Clostridium TaxID=2614128 RepID=UPI00110646F0|nr:MULTISPECIES: DUF3696 domain-containing protein [unclassified Clostridium]